VGAVHSSMRTIMASVGGGIAAASVPHRGPPRTIPPFRPARRPPASARPTRRHFPTCGCRAESGRFYLSPVGKRLRHAGEPSQPQERAGPTLDRRPQGEKDEGQTGVCRSCSIEVIFGCVGEQVSRHHMAHERAEHAQAPPGAARSYKPPLPSVIERQQA
jgi:hypothetical protein